MATKDTDAKEAKLPGPDLTKGIDMAELADGAMLLGHADGEAVLVARRGDECFAVSSKCTHYGGPLAEGLMVDDTIRCPWHHACFSLRTGEVLAAPALDPIGTWAVVQRAERLYVLGKSKGRVEESRSATISKSDPIVIVGGGAAGLAAAMELRREGYSAGLKMISADTAPPCDRPNLSKDYLAGTAEQDWIPLRPKSFYEEHDIELLLDVRATQIDTVRHSIVDHSGKLHSYGALLLATGAEPVKLAIEGAILPHVFYLRTLADSQAIIARIGEAKRAVVIGASFIGLEVAAALRARDLEVRVVAPEARPLEKVLGPELGDFVRGIHEEHGVVFHMGRTAKSIAPKEVILDNGESLEADIVVVGIGVKPSISLAREAGLAIDDGVVVNEYLETSVPGIFAAGDIARWPDPRTGKGIRVEHWVVAQRHGQLAARNMLGMKQPCRFVPFFWSRHYDVSIAYVGHAEKWDEIALDGDLAKRYCRARYRLGGELLAVATVGRDVDSLRAEVGLERLSHEAPRPRAAPFPPKKQAQRLAATR